MAQIIDVYGNCKEVSPKNGTDFSLEEMQSVVGGYIEIVYLDNNELMVVNEEGKLIGLQVNDKATQYMRENSRYDDYVAGNVLVCDSNMIK